MSTINRRSFLRLSGGLAAGSMVAAGLGSAALLSACGHTASPAPQAGRGNGGNTFGLQLYTLRDVIQHDPRAVLAEVRSEEHTSELQSRGHLVCRPLPRQRRHSLTQATCDRTPCTGITAG